MDSQRRVGVPSRRARIVARRLCIFTATTTHVVAFPTNNSLHHVAHRSVYSRQPPPLAARLMLCGGGTSLAVPRVLRGAGAVLLCWVAGGLRSGRCRAASSQPGRVLVRRRVEAQARHPHPSIINQFGPRTFQSSREAILEKTPLTEDT